VRAVGGRDHWKAIEKSEDWKRDCWKEGKIEGRKGVRVKMQTRQTGSWMWQGDFGNYTSHHYG
jgi:hypothetical protein